ncbi:MAG: glycosyltransferase family 2 protein [Planctomycetota bacterium]|jgi:hypothetical protein
MSSVAERQGSDGHGARDGAAPLVSVIIPTHNRAGLIGETLESVFAQDYRPIEAIVVDDGSTDSTESVVRSFEPRARDGLSLRYVRQENSGAPAARNRGLRESKGEYIQFLDSDDLLDPRKLTLQVCRFRRSPSVDFVYSGSSVFRARPAESRVAYTGVPVRAPLLAFLRGLPWNTVAGLYSRAICLRVGDWNEALPCWQDWEYNTRLCLLAPRVAFVPGVMSFVRVASGRISDDAYAAHGVLGAMAALGSVQRLMPATVAASPDVRHSLALMFWILGKRAAIAGCHGRCRQLLREGMRYGRGSWARLFSWLTWQVGRMIGWYRTGVAAEGLVGLTYGLRRRLKGLADATERPVTGAETPLTEQQ